MRTILVALLVVYAVVSTGYILTQIGSGSNKRSGAHFNRSAATADLSLPVAPPFQGAATPPSLSSRQDLLARVAVQNELGYTDLQSFVCNERMERFRAHFNGDNAHQIDTVSAQVSFENGVENYGSIQQNNRERPSLSSISGAWSEGEFGTLLRQTRTLLTTEALSQQNTTDTNGEAAVLLSLNVSGESSPWDLIVGNQKYRVPFKTDVLVSQVTGRILNIKRTSTAMPPDFGISEIQWGVSLKPTTLDGKVWLLPDSGEYSILYQKTNRREWNKITFADYHHYTASSVMHF